MILLKFHIDKSSLSKYQDEARESKLKWTFESWEYFCSQAEPLTFSITRQMLDHSFDSVFPLFLFNPIREEGCNYTSNLFESINNSLLLSAS